MQVVNWGFNFLMPSLKQFPANPFDHFSTFPFTSSLVEKLFYPSTTSRR